MKFINAYTSNGCDSLSVMMISLIRQCLTTNRVRMCAVSKAVASGSDNGSQVKKGV